MQLVKRLKGGALVLPVVFLFFQCSGGSDTNDGEENGTESSQASDRDTATNTDSDSDADSDADGDGDGDADTDGDGDTDTDGDGDADTDGDGDADADSSTGSDSGDNQDSEIDTGEITDDSDTESWWKPTSDAPVHWHWQLSQDFVYPRDVLPNKTVFDIDGELSSAEVVAQLHAISPEVKVICYFDAGVFEDYRSDADRFPESIIGNEDEGWEGSYWLDIRQLDILMPILRDRSVNWCLNKGFDAVEPDETEVWSNNPGFPITKEENNAFNIAVAEMVHELGMSVGLKGNNTEAPELEPYFDWALTEQCWEYDECNLFRDSFVAAGKMVLNVEYDVDPDCESANTWHINSSLRDLDLMGPTSGAYVYEPCIPDSQDTW